MNNLDKYIIWERPCVPGLVFIAAEACVLPHIREFDRPWADTLCFFQDGMVRVVWDKAELTANGVYIAENFLKLRYRTKKLAREAEFRLKLEEQFAILDAVNFAFTSDEVFLKLAEQFNAVFLAWWGFAQVAEPLAAGLEHLLRARHIFSAEEWSIITAPTEKSYTAVEEDEVALIARDILGEPGLLKFFDGSAKDIAGALPNIDAELYERFKDLSARYYWLLNSYAETKVLAVDYFVELVKERLASGATADQITAEISRGGERLSEFKFAKAALIKSRRLSMYDRGIVELMDFLSKYQDDRKALSLKANHYTDLLMKEVARRSGVGYDLIKFASPYEWRGLITGQLAPSKILPRLSYSAFFFRTSGFELYTGDNARRLEKSLLGVDGNRELTEFEGTRAMGGLVSGRVRKILKAADAAEMQQGEILVTTMTTPDFVVAMKKAAAIVTDEGGITCHAAVIARELGLPCVIGTKIATRTLNTGDTIEVRANHGIVKIISRD